MGKHSQCEIESVTTNARCTLITGHTTNWHRDESRGLDWQNTPLEEAIRTYFTVAHGNIPRGIHPHVYKGMKAVLEQHRKRVLDELQRKVSG